MMPSEDGLALAPSAGSACFKRPLPLLLLLPLPTIAVEYVGSGSGESGRSDFAGDSRSECTTV